jgi:hypothetical protein
MELGQASYFKSLEYRQLSAQEADAANGAIAAELGASPQTVVDAYSLTAIDAQGRTQVVNFVRSEANVRLGTFWGWSCPSPCAKPQIFMGFRPES